MKINHVLESRNYLYEGLDASSLRSVKLWESAGHKLVEYQMTADQITKLFAQVQQSATDAGSNRTMIGKGKDAADAVGRAWEDLKTKVANSGPIKNVDAQYDKAAEKLKQATGGDAGVMKYVEKYRKFAKEHPVAQSLIYAALIAAAGISGVGAGGAAALGLLKMTDKLLQGEKFSSAAYAGAKTGATAYAAGQVGKALQGGSPDSGPEQLSGPGMSNSGEAPVANATNIGQAAQQPLAWMSKDPNFGSRINDILSSPDRDAAWKEIFKQQLNHWGGSVQPGSDPGGISRAIQNAIKTADMKAGLTEAQIKRMFHTAARIQQLHEGVWDRVKGAAGQAASAVANKAQTVGTNLTTKVTADKLMSAWKRAGSPTDSDAVAAIMKQAGVDDAIIASSMKAVSGQQSKTDGAGAFDQMANQLAPADADTAKPVDAQTQKFIQQLVASYQALTPAEKAQLKKELEDAVTASDVGSNVVKGTMESRRRKKRSV
jgi:hypothetical protein